MAHTNTRFFSAMLGKKNHSTKNIIYWIVEETENIQDFIFVKFYNQQDKEIFRQKIAGVQAGLLDEHTLEIIKKTENRLIRSFT